ncbi:MAG: hypothetical protein KatS3mg102_2698 [Planctomycetota bacterium]|nr:MAG: hypothetical protein KatS3mg102_2698 [Planctomycetota bacterium]
MPLGRLELPAGLGETLQQLGVQDVAALLELPAAGLGLRYGEAAERLRRLAAGELWAPLVPAPPPPELTARIELEEPAQQLEQLLPLLEPPLVQLLAVLAQRGEGLVALELVLRLDSGATVQLQLRPPPPPPSRRRRCSSWCGCGWSGRCRPLRWQ